MARFYGDLNHGAVTRIGRSHISAHPRGWNTGVFVTGEPEDNEGRDRFDVYVTGGSNGGRTSLIATIREEPGGVREIRFFGPEGGTVAKIQA